MRKITIFHLYRKNGASVFLHPFNNVQTLLNLDPNADITAKYGHEPPIESITLFRNDLYRLVEAAVKRWIYDVKFISRFLFSAAVFLPVYFFFTLIVKDPLPMLDEIVIGIGASVLMYYYLGKRMLKSVPARDKRIELRSQIDRIVFVHDFNVKRIEDALHDFESQDDIEILASLFDSDASFPGEDENDIRDLISCLERRFQSKELRRNEKRLSRRRNEKAVERFYRWAVNKNLDIPLFAVYKKVKAMDGK